MRRHNGEAVTQSESSAEEADYPMNLHWIMPAKGRINARPFCCGMRVCYLRLIWTD